MFYRLSIAICLESIFIGCLYLFGVQIYRLSIFCLASMFYRLSIFVWHLYLSVVYICLESIFISCLYLFGIQIYRLSIFCLGPNFGRLYLLGIYYSYLLGIY